MYTRYQPLRRAVDNFECAFCTECLNHRLDLRRGINISDRECRWSAGCSIQRFERGEPATRARVSRLVSNQLTEDGAGRRTGGIVRYRVPEVVSLCCAVTVLRLLSGERERPAPNLKQISRRKTSLVVTRAGRHSPRIRYPRSITNLSKSALF